MVLHVQCDVDTNNCQHMHIRVHFHQPVEEHLFYYSLEGAKIQVSKTNDYITIRQ